MLYIIAEQQPHMRQGHNVGAAGGGGDCREWRDAMADGHHFTHNISQEPTHYFWISQSSRTEVDMFPHVLSQRPVLPSDTPCRNVVSERSRCVHVFS